VAEVEANVPKEAMDINTGVRMVMKKALQHDGLARGLHEAARAIEKGQVCFFHCNLWVGRAAMELQGFLFQSLHSSGSSRVTARLE
jgi:hypothetical protein